MEKPNEKAAVEQPKQPDQNQGNADLLGGLVDGDSNFEKLMSEAPLVSVKREEQPKETEPEAKADVQEPEDSEEPESTGRKIKIRDFELSEDEWIEAFNDRSNRSKWQKNLTQKSQIASKILPNLREEDLQYLLPYAMGQKALPENLKDALIKSADLPKTLKFKDAEENEFEVNTTDLPDEFVQQLAKKALSEAYPEINKLHEENAKLSEELEKTKKVYESYNQRMFERTVRDYMKEHPDTGIEVRNNESVRDALATIMQSGEVHPEYEKAQKFLLVSQFAQNAGLTLDEAHTKLFGSTEARKKAAEKAKKNQQEDMPRERGKEPEKTWIESEIEQMSNSTYKVMNDFGI